MDTDRTGTAEPFLIHSETKEQNKKCSLHKSTVAGVPIDTCLIKFIGFIGQIYWTKVINFNLVSLSIFTSWIVLGNVGPILGLCSYILTQIFQWLPIRTFRMSVQGFEIANDYSRYSKMSDGVYKTETNEGWFLFLQICR